MSPGIYLPSNVANGTKVRVISGSAGVYAGAPSAASHYYLGTVNAGQTFTISGVAPGEVVSVQADYGFTYELTLATTQTTGSASQFLTWTCTGSPCPWGSSTGAHAVVWPANKLPTASRLGYTVSSPAYLPATAANGVTVKVTSGTASLYAGAPNASSHIYIGTLSSGQSAQVSGLAADEVLSVQSDLGFLYEITYPSATTPPPSVPQSQSVSWNCTGSPCPWGTSLSGRAIVWPSDKQPIATRLGYTVSGAIYLPTSIANGTGVKILSGSASLYAGAPGADSHRLLGTIGAGQSYNVFGLQAGEVLSVQGDNTFTYELTFGLQPPSDPPPSNPPPAGSMQSVNGRWTCNTSSCSGGDWFAPVISWPSWAAYSSNNRSGNNSRTVYDAATGQALHPYMGSWANGCTVKAETGTVLIVEWKRGTDEWRETFLEAGESHTIHLVSPEDGAMIESYDFAPAFSISLTNCTPQPLP